MKPSVWFLVIVLMANFLLAVLNISAGSFFIGLGNLIGVVALGYAIFVVSS